MESSSPVADRWACLGEKHRRRRAAGQQDLAWREPEQVLPPSSAEAEPAVPPARP